MRDKWEERKYQLEQIVNEIGEESILLSTSSRLQKQPPNAPVRQRLQDIQREQSLAELLLAMVGEMSLIEKRQERLYRALKASHEEALAILEEEEDGPIPY